MNNIVVNNFKEIFLKKAPLLDVRAEVEFQEGSLPGATNIPILNTEERVLIGTAYKKQGEEAAIKLGYEIVSNLNKENKISAWSQFIQNHPQAILFCFRGGKRSLIAQAWLKEVGLEVPLIVGGYKKVRQFLIKQIELQSKSNQFLLLSGVTGSGKTRLLHSLKSKAQFLDLEKIANHKGSAFGYINGSPTQINFENQLAVEFLKLEKLIELSHKNLIVTEDESRLIGPCIIPEVLFSSMRVSEVILIEESLEFRVNEIYQDYILCSKNKPEQFERHLNSLEQIQKKLGGARYKEIKEDIMKARECYYLNKDLESNKTWIEKLLVYYYDPIYLDSLRRRQVQKKMTGSFKECQSFLNSLF